MFLVFNLLAMFHLFPADWKINYRVYSLGNVLLFVVTYLSFLLHIKALRNPNPHVFVRMLYSSLLVKMLVCLAAVLIYAVASGGAINRNGIIACVALYLSYTVLEVMILQQLYREKPKNV